MEKEKYQMDKAKSLLLVVTLIHFSGLAVGARTKVFPAKGQNSAAIAMTPQASDDGICKLMVETNGYACVEHTVTTKDGYILGLQQIQKGLGLSCGNYYNTSGVRPQVLLQHGLLMDGSTWLLLPPGQSLAFFLVDNGYDVWIANTRGTKYSNRHVLLTPDDHAYWQWSWDELAAFDLPPVFEYAHAITGEKLHYVGHSQGTLVALAAFSKGQLLDMLRSAALLSPIAYLGQMTSTLVRAGATMYLGEVLYELGIHEFNPIGETVAQFIKVICEDTGVDPSNMLIAITGQNCCVEPSTMDLFFDHSPQPSATKNMIHLSQMTRTGTLAMYDYNDEEENRKNYGQPTPPVYNMESIPNDLPLFVSYGGADALSDVEDVQLLLDSLKHHDRDKLVIQYIDHYAHADFVMGASAKQDLYDPLLAFFKLH